jgi:hypothetical protein
MKDHRPEETTLFHTTFVPIATVVLAAQGYSASEAQQLLEFAGVRRPNPAIGRSA